MLSDKTLCIALLISLVFHLTIFLPFSYKRRFTPKQSPVSLKITYVRPKETFTPKTVQEKGKPILKVSAEQTKAETPVAQLKKIQEIEKEPVKEIVKAPQPKTEQAKIIIPPELPKEKEALYLDYYQSIRKKIRGFVLQNYPRFIACGEVCLYFVLLSDGKLKEIKIVEERSCSNRLLKEIAKKSVLEAAPFFPFPKDLNQPQLPFNVIISFEAEN